MVTTFACTALLGMTIAYFTALRGQGISQKDLQEYDKGYSSYVIDKPAIAEHQRIQDEAIATLRARQDQVFDRLNKLENDQKLDEKDRDNLRGKLDVANNLLTELSKPKK
jgi:hypothetical protein